MSDTPRYARGQVIEIINSVIDKVDADKSVAREVFLHLSELANIIDSLKKDISSVQPGHVKNSHIPEATDELGAVVTATADATNKIMSVCEEIETIAGSVEGEPGEDILNKITQIYEACGFQDITGQRIRNVVVTLQVIETKIDKILETLNQTVGLKLSDEKYEKVVSIDNEKSLLNGPQMPDKAVTQDDIDKLLAEFDTR
jgi:chemotaxis protein CheZ